MKALITTTLTMLTILSYTQVIVNPGGGTIGTWFRPALYFIYQHWFKPGFTNCNQSLNYFCSGWSSL
jgi:hypothetical protein